MSTYLESNSPNAWQYGWTVNGTPVRSVPQVILHTYQAGWPALHGRNGGMTGAGYIRSRRDSAGYHHLTGLDTSVQLAPWSAATAHAIPVNTWAKGISAMWFAGRWDELSVADQQTLVYGMAQGAHEYSKWCVAQGLGPVPARFLTRAQAMARMPGFADHGTLQNDRSDPGADFPRQMFLRRFEELETGLTVKGIAAMTADEFWNHRGRDYIHDNPQIKDTLIARTHQNSHNQPNRVWLRERNSLVTGARISMSNTLAHAHRRAQSADEGVKRLDAKVDALAEVMDEILNGQGRILKAVRDAEFPAITPAIEEIAERLQISVEEAAALEEDAGEDIPTDQEEG